MPTFFARRDYPGLHSTFVQVADTNGDGIPDLIASEQGFIEVLFGNGNGTFRTGQNTNTGVSAPSFVATHLLGDGKVDLVFPVGNGIAVCTGNGDGILDVATPGAMGVWLFTGKGDGPSILACWRLRCHPPPSRLPPPISTGTTSWTW
jgi:hypothetical protein